MIETIKSRFVLIAAVTTSLGLLSLTAAPQAASATTKLALAQSYDTGYPGWRHPDHPWRRPGTGAGLQPDYQYYFNTPGYFPGFYPAAGLAREFDPPVGSGFPQGPLGVH